MRARTKPISAMDFLMPFPELITWISWDERHLSEYPDKLMSFD